MDSDNPNVNLPFDIILKILLLRKDIKQKERYKKNFDLVIDNINNSYDLFINELMEELYYVYNDDELESYFFEYVEGANIEGYLEGLYFNFHNFVFSEIEYNNTNSDDDYMIEDDYTDSD